MKLPLIALALLALAYAVWSLLFVHSGLNNVMHDTQGKAMGAAMLAALELDNAQVIPTSGVSNSMGGETLKGYVVVVEVEFSELRKDQFAVFRSKRGNLINHRLRIKTDDGWIAEGDGNRGPDQTLVTADNLIGVVYNNTAYRY